MSTERTSLLGLPVELRLKIYEICLNRWVPHRLKNFNAITLVSHQTRGETLPILLRERYLSMSIKSFVNWTATSPPHLLRHITDLFCIWTILDSLHPAFTASDQSLTARQKPCHLLRHITDLFCIWTIRPPLHPASTGSDQSSKARHGPVLACISMRNPALERAFSSVPNLKRLRLGLSIRDFQSDGAEHHGRSDDQETLLRNIAVACPKLVSLELSTDLIRMDSLKGFHNMTSLTWSGYSLSTPQETLTSLKSLECLHTVRLERWPEQYDHQHYSVSTAQLHKHLSFTSEVLQNLRPLRHFRISHTTSRVQSDFLTTAIFKSLSSHRRSLVDLDLMSDYYMEDAVMQEILNVASTFNLARVWLHLFSVPKNYTAIDIGSCIRKSVKDCGVWLRYLGDGNDPKDLKHRFLQ